MKEADLPKIFSYIGGIIRSVSGFAYTIGGRPDHIHILADIPSTTSLSDFVRTIKANTSKWVKTLDAEYKDLFSLKIQPFESDAEVSGNTKVVEINSFRFTVDKNAEFHKFDNGGDYAYVLGGENTTLGTGYIDTYNREDEVLQKNEAVSFPCVAFLKYHM